MFASIKNGYLVIVSEFKLMSIPLNDIVSIKKSDILEFELPNGRVLQTELNLDVYDEIKSLIESKKLNNY
jgi:hypothetical protein